MKFALQLDFEKSFDTIEHRAILDILKAKFFGDKWMNMLFISATSVVLLNGVLGKKVILQERGKTRGLFSPLLFVLAADLLQSVLNKAQNLGLLTAPIQVNSCLDFPIAPYADVTLAVLQGDSR